MDPITWNHDTTLIPGAEINGFVRGSYTGSFDEEEGPAVGNYVQADFETKIAVAIGEITDPISKIKVAGKYTVDGSVNGKLVEFTKLEPLTVRLGGTLAVTGGYAFTISDLTNGKGIKVITTITLKGIKNQTIDLGGFISLGGNSEGGSVDPSEFLEDVPNPFTQFTVTAEIYDNNNKRRYSETTNFNELLNLVATQLSGS
jgi:hypothetical protein